MNNEPVAIVELGGEITWLTDVLPYKAKLYTHPVKELTHEEYDSIFANGKRLGVIETENRLWKAMQLTDEEIHQAIRRGFSREGFLSDGIFLEIKELLRKAQE